MGLIKVFNNLFLIILTRWDVTKTASTGVVEELAYLFLLLQPVCDVCQGWK